jgi:hypothetical protein
MTMRITTTPRRAAAALAVAVLAAGCASTPRPAAAPQPPAPAPLSAATALTYPGGTWAAIPMGTTGPNLFWQLFLLPAAGGRWSLQTPPDIATNGALILAAQDGTGPDASTLVTGVRPSLDLTFSPVTTTRDNGRNWATLPPDPGLADVPDALAASPSGQLLALGQDQQVKTASVASGSTAGWVTLTSQHALAATPAGHRCALTSLTAAAYTPSGTPLLGGTCTRAGTAGIFTATSGTWQLTGPVLPAALASQPIQILRLTRTGNTDTAILEAGTGSSASLITAWATGSTRHWTLSPALPLRGAQPVSASFGGSGATAVTLTSGRGEILTGPRASWQQLPALPAGRTVTLALPAAGTTDALAADGSTLTAWQLTTGQARWSRTQVIKVPIQYGSSS